MRAILLFVLLAIVGCTHCQSFERQAPAEKVLFVGNSLTYVGNVPAVFAALATANGRPVAADMIVRGGATLSQRMTDRSVERALANGGYKLLVLQERGGDLMCSFGPESCVDSRRAILHLAGLGKQHGVQVVLLGTYQPHPSASRRLVAKESEAAAQAGIPYIEVSEKLQRLRKAEPELAWFAADGAHPGKDLALLNGVLVYQAFFGSLPEPKALTIRAPIYGSTSGLKETLRRSDAPPPRPETPLEIAYPAEVVEKLLSVIGATGPGTAYGY